MSVDSLLIMRPYQIVATERILWKIKSTYENKNWSKPESGGFIWHTTGSGKTLTSFKAARLATELPFIDKVFLFVVDRKDLTSNHERVSAIFFLIASTVRKVRQA